MTEPGTDHDEAIRARLHRLLQDRSQSEIARKTGTPVAGVNRYVHGARIPAAFCAALSRELGVNPVWLLVGEGAPFLTDMPAATAKLGENLLELVEALNAIERMKLGSLTGSHARVLRTLNDALQAHERLRTRLNEQSRPLFARVLKDLESALNRLDLERAQDLRAAAGQVSRLCDDEGLAREYLRLQAFHEFQRKDPRRMLVLQRRLFLASLPEQALFDARACDEARRLVLALSQMNRLPEALRICRAARVLAGRPGRAWESFARLQLSYSLILFETGWLRRGLKLLQQCLPGLSGMHAKVGQAQQLRMMLWGGMLALPAAMQMGEPTDAKADHFLQVAIWTGEREPLEAALRYAQAPDVQPVWRGRFWQAFAAEALDQLRQRSPAAARKAARMPANVDSDAAAGMLDKAARMHLLLLAGDAKGARELWQESEAMRRSCRPDLSPHPMALCLHHRTALRLFGPQERRAAALNARRFFRRWGSRGFALLAGLAIRS
ncbi:MAG: helix-turn-helix transcriptional regulator [Planctomycetes bacterium]|nr:helix-turn-helix transcriptional regulator [Planctomycetota bacterium]